MVSSNGNRAKWTNQAPGERGWYLRAAADGKQVCREKSGVGVGRGRPVLKAIRLNEWKTERGEIMKKFAPFKCSPNFVSTACVQSFSVATQNACIHLTTPLLSLFSFGGAT